EKNVTNGKAISLVSTDHRVLLKKIEKLLNYRIERRNIPNPLNMKNIPEKYASNLKSSQKNTKRKRKNRINHQISEYNSQKTYSKNRINKNKKKKYYSKNRQKISSSVK
ncbi:MAG: hypothetical protein ACTSX0_07470, partial [Promethearchaeota archaeon]